MKSQNPGTGVFFLLVLCFVSLSFFTTAGCSIMHSGHAFDISEVSSIVPHETSSDDVIGMFGQPDSIMRKPDQGIAVYVFKNTTNTAFRIPLPPGIPLFSIGKSKVTGYQLNIVIEESTEKVLGYEWNELKGRLSDF